MVGRARHRLEEDSVLIDLGVLDEPPSHDDYGQ